VASPHDWSFPYNEHGTLRVAMEKKGIKGVSYPKHDWTICTYCVGLTRVMLMASAWAWKGVHRKRYQGKPEFDESFFRID
jgi:hypothetical protein